MYVYECIDTRGHLSFFLCIKIQAIDKFKPNITLSVIITINLCYFPSLFYLRIKFDALDKLPAESTKFLPLEKLKKLDLWFFNSGRKRAEDRSPAGQIAVSSWKFQKYAGSNKGKQYIIMKSEYDKIFRKIDKLNLAENLKTQLRILYMTYRKSYDGRQSLSDNTRFGRFGSHYKPDENNTEYEKDLIARKAEKKEDICRLWSVQELQHFYKLFERVFTQVTFSIPRSLRPSYENQQNGDGIPAYLEIGSFDEATFPNIYWFLLERMVTGQDKVKRMPYCVYET